MTAPEPPDTSPPKPLEVRVRRIHRRDLNRTWEFLKLVFRDVNLETVEFQRPRTKRRFLEVYDEEGIEQLLFEVGSDVVGYAECAFEAIGDDNWVNPRYFEKRDMRPLFVEELATHPDYQGKGVGSFMLDQLQHLARVRGCTHLVLEVAENNENALTWYRKRNFYKLDAAIFMAQKIENEPELLPPRKLGKRRPTEAEAKSAAKADAKTAAKAAAKAAVKAAAKASVKAAAKPPAKAKKKPAPRKKTTIAVKIPPLPPAAEPEAAPGAPPAVPAKREGDAGDA
jgi:ribosomal protein S18 acetylase RimI-like enzyme